MSVSIPPLWDPQKSYHVNDNAIRNKKANQLSFDLYLLQMALGTTGSASANNYEFTDLLNMKPYNKIAMSAAALGNEPGILQKASNATSTMLEQAKSIAQNISTQFEGGQVTGNFDGQGLSVGYLQWNIGSGTLQPLLQEMSTQYPNEFEKIFNSKVLGEDANGKTKMSDILKSVFNQSQSEQLQWAKSINRSNQIVEPWKSAFNQLVKNDQFIEIEAQYSKPYQNKATQMMNELGVKTVRGYALAFDIAVQNGSIKPSAKALVQGALVGQSNKLTNSQDSSLTKNQKEIVIDLGNRLQGVADTGLRKLYYTAAAVAITSKDQFAKDVWSRKVAIIAGEGKVHGQQLALEKNMGLNDQQIG